MPKKAKHDLTSTEPQLASYCNYKLDQGGGGCFVVLGVIHEQAVSGERL